MFSGTRLFVEGAARATAWPALQGGARLARGLGVGEWNLLLCLCWAGSQDHTGPAGRATSAGLLSRTGHPLFFQHLASPCPSTAPDMSPVPGSGTQLQALRAGLWSQLLMDFGML